MKKPSDISLSNGQLFGLETSFDEASVIVLPLPWEVSTSYRRGTSLGPKHVLESSAQIELWDEDEGNIWQKGIHMIGLTDPVISSWSDKNKALSDVSWKVVKALENGASVPSQSATLNTINESCATFVNDVSQYVEKILGQKKAVVGLGGDHSVTEGLIAGLTEHMRKMGQSSLGLLQFDAHMDLRKAYEGFKHSHASVIYNLVTKNRINTITQVGIRDYSEDEKNIASEQSETITTFYDRKLKYDQFRGKTWHEQSLEIVETLPQTLYVTIDIDVLKPSLCSQTGTPVPGGLELDHIFYTLNMAKKVGKSIIGADLVEVGGMPNTIDTIVASRALYRLIGALNTGSLVP